MNRYSDHVNFIRSHLEHVLSRRLDFRFRKTTWHYPTVAIWAYRSDRLGPIAPSIFTQPCNLSFMARFADINVSHDSVATYARCGGILNIHLTTNLLENLPVNFLKIG